MPQNSAQEPGEVTWSGTVARFTFKNTETGFAVVRLQSDPPGGLVTVVGILAQFNEGQQLRLTGKVTEHARFGRQMEVRLVESEAPKTMDGLVAYLGSGLAPATSPCSCRPAAPPPSTCWCRSAPSPLRSRAGCSPAARSARTAPD